MATVFSNCEVTMIGFFRIRSAITPPAREKTRDGSIKASITHVRSSGDPVMS